MIMELTEIQNTIRRLKLPERLVPLDCLMVGPCWASLKEWRSEIRAFIGRDYEVPRLDEIDELLISMDAYARQCEPVTLEDSVRLAKAAPEMLELLERTVVAFDGNGEMPNWCKEARAIIARAKGG